MAKNKSNNDNKPAKNIGILDRAAKTIIANMDPGYSDRELISNSDAKIQDIINKELDLCKGISNGNIIDFVTNVMKSDTNVDGKEIDLFTQDIGETFGHFQDQQKNRYIELTDLKFISKFIPAIGEAVKVTLDSIVSSDDYASTITRNLVLSPALSDIDKSAIEAEIKSFEKSYKLPNKLKNIVYKNAIVSGDYYVYIVPYRDLFVEYNRLVENGSIQINPLVNKGRGKKIKNKEGFNLKSATESTSDLIYEGAMENAFNIDNYFDNIGDGFTDIDRNIIKSCLSDNLSNINTVKTTVLTEALEGYRSVDIMQKNLKNYSNTFGDVGFMDVDSSNPTIFSDATTDTKDKKGSNFKTTGAYIKLISPNKMVPVVIYNQTIGYLHVHDTNANQKNSSIKKASSDSNLMNSTASIFNSTKLADSKRDKAAKAIIDTITDGILTNFSDKFVNKHSDFKDLIADCVISNGLVNNSFQIQFIPANNIVAFTINENEDGIGQSILADALFPAKLLLSLVVSKLLTYMNNSGDKTIAHVRKGPIDINSGNHTQRVIRMMQEAQITFSDLLSTNLSFAKFNRDKNVQIPMAKNGDRLIDFEVQSGQEVDLSTTMEQWLEKLAIIGTGVPSVIMEYTDVADHAKSISTANIKFAGRIASLQSDLEEATTELYRKFLECSSLDDTLKAKIVSSFEYKLCRPKVLSNSNMADYLSAVQSSIDGINTLFFGQGSEPHTDEVKQVFNKNLAISMLPFIDWKEYEELLEKAKIEVQQNIDLNASEMGSDLGGADEDEDL